MIFHELGLGL